MRGGLANQGIRMSQPRRSVAGAARTRSFASVVSLAMVATLLPASAAVASHAEPTRPQTVLVQSGPAAAPSISADGTRIVFEAPGRCDGNQDGEEDVCDALWLFEREPGEVHGTAAQLELPVAEGASLPDGDVKSPEISGDGRYIAFVAHAQNLANTVPQRGSFEYLVRAYRYDLEERVLEHLDVDGDGTGFETGVRWHMWDGGRLAISHDGSRVAFASAEQGVHREDHAIHVWDAEDGYAWPASLRPGGGIPGHAADFYDPFGPHGAVDPSLSPDGRWLAYQGPADMDQAEPADPAPRLGPQVWLQEVDRAGDGAPHLVSSWDSASRSARQPTVSDPVGELPYVAFVSRDPAAGEDPDTYGGDDVYRWDGNRGEAVFLRMSPAPPRDGGDAEAPSISADGSRVAFSSDVPNLVPDDDNWSWDAFVATVRDGEVTVERASVRSDGAEGGVTEQQGSYDATPAISGDGSAATFVAPAFLVDDVGTNVPSLYVRDLDEGTSPPDGGGSFTAAITPLTATPRAGEPTNVRIGFTDPLGTESTQYTYDLAWGDGTTIDRAPISAGAVAVEGPGTAGELDLSHTYAEPGSHTISLTVRVEEEDGAGREVTATPRAITVAAGPELSVGPPTFDPPFPVEGDVVTATFPYEDADDRADVASIQWGPPGASTVATMASDGGQRYLSASYTYRQRGTWRVSAQVTDEEAGEAAFEDVDLVVGNAPPVITSVSGDPRFGGTAPLEVTLYADFTDAGWANTHTATVEWGDGTDTSTPATVEFADGEGMATASYTYASPGEHTATVTISDGLDEVRDEHTFVVSPEALAVQVFPYLVGGGAMVAGSPVGAEITAYDQTNRQPYEWEITWGDDVTSSGGGVGASTINDAPGNYVLDPSPGDTHVYEEAGTYEVVARVRPEGGSTWVESPPVEYVIAPADSSPTTVGIDDFGVHHVSAGPDGISVLAGARDVRISNIPLEDLAPRGSSALGAPLHRIDLAATPLHRIPLHRIPLHRIPLHRIDVPDEAPMTLGDLALDALPLDRLTLTQVPLLRTGGWSALLAGTALADQPLQTLTLADVHAADLLAAIAVDEIDLAATPLSEVSLASVLLGDVTLDDVPVPDGTTDWCGYLASIGSSCDGFGADDPILGAEFAGLSTASSGITAAPLHRIDVNGIPLHRIEVQDIPLHRIPLHRIPLHRIDLNVSPLHRIPLHRIPLHRIDVQQTPLHRIPLHRIPLHRIDAVVDCSGGYCDETSGKTLEDAVADGRLLDGATLGDLQGAFPEELTIGHLLYLIAAAIEGGEDPDGLSLTFNDILVGLLEAIDFPWEELPFGQMGVSRFAPYEGQSPLTYDVDFTVGGPAGAADTTVTFTLPDGFTVVQPAYADGPVGELSSTGEDTSGVALVDLDVDGRQVSAGLEGLGNGAWNLAIDVRPGITLGTFRSDVEVRIDEAGTDEDGAPVPAVDERLEAVPVTVTEHWEDAASNAPATAPRLSSDTVYLAHLGTPGDIDYYRVPVSEAGQRISVRLTNLDADADLVLYQPVDPRSAPLHRIGTDSLPLGDEGYGSDASRTDLAPEVLQDVPVQVSPLHRISANRGDADESIEVISTSADVAEGGYVIQVSGYNGAATDTPYVLRVRVTDPPPAPACSNTFPNAAATSTGGWTAGSVPVGTDTILLVNEPRMRRLYAGPAVDDIVAAVNRLVATSAGHGTKAAVLPVDQLGDVASAYADWDAEGQGCVPARANAVVEAIAGALDDLRTSHPSIANVVVVGGDDVIPFARIEDTTRYNQRTYADLVGDVNPIGAAFATEHLLSDDPYGDPLGTPWLNRRLHVSEIAVGRLVESPSDITAQLDRFVQSGGRVDPDTALVTGYDFLTDGAEAVSAGLAAGTTQRRAIVPEELIDETWSRRDVIDSLFPAGDSPGIASINAHYDHSRSLPAAPHADHSEDDDDLFTIDDIEPGRLVGRILFTMGCHAGLAVPDRYAGSEAGAAADWAQTFGSELAVYVANTGYGYGDDTAVALSEKLMALLAENLDGTMTVGDALAAAKHDYVSGMGVYGSYDEKVVQQTVLYGLPMYRIGPEPPAPAAPDATSTTSSGASTAAPVGTVTDPTTGLPVATAGIALGANGFGKVDTPRGTYWQVPGQDPQVSHWRPIQPKTVLDVTRPGVVARGALITGLASTDTTGVDTVFARPAVGPSANEPEIEFGGVAFPARLSNLSTAGGPEGRRDRLALMPGQFFSDVDSGSTRGTQRLFGRVETLVYYGDLDATDTTPPQIEASQAFTDDGEVLFSTEVSDAAGVMRVLVLFKDASGAWTPLDLVESDGRWVGSSPANVGSGPTPNIEWFVQAVDGSGNVGASTNKGAMFPTQVLPDDPDEHPFPDPGAVPAGPVAPTFAGPVGGDGWFTGPVSIDGPDGQTAEPAVITEDGLHVVTVRRSGASATYLVAVDATDPVVTISSPSGQDVEVGAELSADFACVDATSGVASCTASVTPPSGPAESVVDGGRLPTARGGTYTLEVTAVDRAGNRSKATATYRVVGDRYRFDGFFAPINDEVVNQVKAGQVVPVKFRVWDGDDLVSDPSLLDVRVVVTSCPSSADANPVYEEVASNAKAELKWDAENQQFVYTHRTEKKWTGCRTVIVTLAHPDGSSAEHAVVFSYRR
jgi:Tol biopolymer transport system component